MSNVAIVEIELCNQCSTSISAVDEAYDLFICEPPKSADDVGLAITVSLARTFALGLDHGQCISHIYDDIYNMAVNLPFYHEYIRQTACLNYPKLQRAIYTCLANCKILGLLKDTKCDSGEKNKEMALVCDVVFCGPPDYAGEMKRYDVLCIVCTCLLIVFFPSLY